MLEFLDFVKSQIKEPDRELVMVMDNHSAHRNKVTIAHMKLLNIEPLFMSPYSPELNSIESLWGIAKSRVKKTLYTQANHHAIT